MRGGARFDATGTYRYYLWREWDAAAPTVTFVLLNPSTADAEHDDPTLRRCVGFARRWGCGRLELLNLFALRATSPAELRRAADPVGPENDTILRAARGVIVVGWGNHGALHGRDREVLGLLGEVLVLGFTKQGQPRHPLYVRGDWSPLRLGRAPGSPSEAERVPARRRVIPGLNG